jgi:para-nitrobenzyl esterase
MVAAGCIGITASAAAHEPATPNPVVTAAGVLQGSTKGAITAYFGVPFAAPPVGDLRWRAPQAARPWQGVRTADHFGDQCMQDFSLPDGGAPTAASVIPHVSEDCLYLNLWMPAHGTSRLPVMVYVHGGGFEHGAGSQGYFDGKTLLGSDTTTGASLAARGVVVVTLNYRLGKFGFFAHPALTRENPTGSLGNYGLLDQIAALKWVQENIAAFGGDPKNVTVFGGSAGGVSISYLMESPLATGLFQKAIIESGFIDTRVSSAGHSMPATLQQAEAAGSAAAKSWGSDIDDAAALRRIPAARILGHGGPPTTWPVIDGKIVPEDPFAAFEAGRIAHISLLLGTNSFEAGGAFLPIAAQLPRQFAAQWPTVLSVYDDPGTHPAANVAAELLTDLMFTAPTRRAARAAAGHGLPTYLYRFSYVGPSMRDRVPGAFHGDELSVLLYPAHLVDPQTTAAHGIVDAVQSRWVQFAKSGHPSRDAAQWPAFTRGAESLLDFTNSGPVIRTDYAHARLDLADALASPP